MRGAHPKPSEGSGEGILEKVDQAFIETTIQSHLQGSVLCRAVWPSIGIPRANGYQHIHFGRPHAVQKVEGLRIDPGGLERAPGIEQGLELAYVSSIPFCDPCSDVLRIDNLDRKVAALVGDHQQ